MLKKMLGAGGVLIVAFGVVAAAWKYREPLQIWYALGTVPALRFEGVRDLEGTPFAEFSLTNTGDHPLYFVGSGPSHPIALAEGVRAGKLDVFDYPICGTGLEVHAFEPGSTVSIMVVVDEEYERKRAFVELQRTPDGESVSIYSRVFDDLE